MANRHRPPISDDDSTTQDLGTNYRGVAPAPVDPAAKGNRSPEKQTEEHIQARGKYMVIFGLTVTLLSAALAVVWDFGYDNDIPLGVLLPLQAAGLGAAGLGCMEYLSRPHRYTQRECLERINRLEDAFADLVGLMDEELQQRFYKGVAWKVRNDTVTGTEAGRPVNEYRSGEVLRFRQRNGRT